MAIPKGLGDTSAPEFQLKKEEYPLPGSRKELIARIETLIGAGGVQKLVVEMKRPIQVFRLVPQDELSQVPPESPADDLWNQMHNGDVREVLPPPDSAHPLFFAFHAMSAERLRPAAIFVLNKKILRKWLKLPESFNLSSVYGVDVFETAEMANDAVVLVGASLDDLNYDVIGFRVPVDLPKSDRPPDPPKMPPGTPVG